VSDNRTPQDYFTVSYEHRQGSCWVKFLNNRQFTWPLKAGDSLADRWPSDMTFSMDPERPKDVTLTDYVQNLEGVLLASPRLATFLRDQGLPDLEFLPVSILDHKGRVASPDYAIVQCCRVIDCVDQDKSAFEWDGLEKPTMTVSRMVLASEALGENDRLIRPKFVPGEVFYRADLREALNQQRFTGLAFSRELFGDMTVYRGLR
jgi:hypothetical protein